VLFALPIKSFAQPFVQFIAQSATIDCETNTLSIDLDVKDFIDMNVFQFSVNWDSSILTLNNINNPQVLSGISPSNGTAPSGYINFSWFSSAVTINDATILTFEFDVVGTPGLTNITFEATQPIGVIDIVQYGQALDSTQYTLTSGNINITDSEDPTISCPSGLPTFDTGGAATTTITGAAPTTDDNCGVDFISYELTMNGNNVGIGTGDVSNNVNFGIGTTTVTYTANDFVGNTETCSFDVIVTNNNAPTDLIVSVDSIQVDCETNTILIGMPVFNFIDVIGLQFTLEWDETKLEFVSIVEDNFNPNGNPGLGQVANGSFNFSWFDNTNPTTFQNGDSILVLEFNILDPTPGNDYDINFVNLPLSFSVTTPASFPLNDPNAMSEPGNIEIIDTDAPTINCPANISINSINGTDAVVNGIAPTTSDNCGIMDTTYTLTDVATSNNIGNGTGDASGTAFPVGTTTVEYTVTDFGGNTVTCNFDVTVQSPGVITVTVDSIQVDCETGKVLIGLPVFNFTDVIGLQFTLEWDETKLEFVSIVEDNFTPNGNPGLGQVANGSFNFSWFDNTNPTTFQDGDSILVLEFNILDPTVGNDYNFNFVNLPLSFSVTTPTSFPLNDPTAISEPGNIEIIDDTDPMIICPADVTVNSNGAASVVVNNIAATATDNCGTPAISYMIFGNPSTVGTGDASGNTFLVGTTMVTYTATDEGGNSVNCSFNVIVIQDQLTIECPMDINQGTDTNICSATLDLPVTILSDPNNINTISWDITGTSGPVSGTGNISNFTFSLGTSTIVYTVTDNFGASETCSFQVTITDQDAPIISGIPADTTVECDNIPAAATPTAMDQCDGVTSVNLISESVAAGPTLGSSIITRTWSTVDVAGNIATANQTITVIDTTAPMITCPADISLNSTTSPVCGANPSWTVPTASDNCDMNVQVTSSFTPGDFFPLGTTIVTYYAEDNAGNIDSCKFNVTISDMDVPVFTDCPTNMTISLGVNCDTIVTWTEPTITDNCDNNVSVVASPPLGTVFMAGTTTVTYTATDASGNVSTCSFDITVADMEAPVLTNCPIDMTVSSGVACDTVITWIEPTITDNCDDNVTIAVFPASGTVFMPGTTTVTYTVVDASGNLSTCSFDITVTDTEAPVFTNCPIDMTVPAGVNCDTIVTWVEPTIADNCDNNVSVVVSPPLGTIFMAGTTTVTYTATDASGNISTCSFDITVADTEGPVLTNCPVDMTIPSGIGCDTIPNWIEPTITDNCDNNVSVLVIPPLGTTFMVGTTNVTYTATDASGNVSTCSFDVTVADTEGPVLTNCPMDMTVPSGVACDTIVTWIEPTITDNCDNNVTVVVSPPLGTAFVAGTTTVTYTATDGNGNISICSFDITVADTEGPIIMDCPMDITLPAGNNCSATALWDMPTATDNCDPSPTITCNISSGNTFSVGTTPIICTATDASGNESTCTFNVIIVDVQPPSVFCPANIIVSSSGEILSDPNQLLTTTMSVGCDSVILSFDNPSGNDNCGIPTVTQSLGLPSGSTFGVGDHVIQFTAMDGSGNTNTVICETTITVTSFFGLNVTATPDIVCTGGSTQLFADPFTPIPGATYSWNGPNPNRMISNIANPFLDNLTFPDAGTYIVTVTDPTTNCISIDSVVVVVSQGPELALLANINNCVNPDSMTNIPLSVQVTNAVVVDSFIWTNPAGVVFSNDQNTVIPNATEAASGQYCVEVFEVDGCSNTICETIQITHIPTAPIIISSCGDFICIGEPCTLTGVSVDVDSIIWTATGNGPGLPSDVNQSEITITPIEIGFHLYTYTIIENGCESSSSLGIIVSSPANVAPDFFPVELNTTLNNFDVTDNDIINGTLPGIFNINVTSDVSNGMLVNHSDGTFTYTPDNGFLGDDQFIYEICFDCDGEEVCRWAIVTLSIETDECIVPTVISPNGDGMNDTWEISCVKNNPDNEVVIFNRWGDEVYRAEPYNNDWEGTYNNEDLPDGTYFYIFKKSANDPDPLKGTVNIYR